MVTQGGVVQLERTGWSNDDERDHVAEALAGLGHDIDLAMTRVNASIQRFRQRINQRIRRIRRPRRGPPLAWGLAAALALVSAAAGPVASADPPAPTGAALAPPGDPAWQPVVFPSIERSTLWKAVVVDGARAWRGSAACAASSLALAIEPPLELTGPGAPSALFLSWRWRIEQPLAAPTDERSREGDDFAARVSALFALDEGRASFGQRAVRRVFRLVYGVDPPGRSLSFLWARALPRGTGWTSPYAEQSRMIALRGPDDGAGWHDERVDLLAEYRLHFDGEPTALAGISLMTDSDNGCEKAEALYTGLALERRP